MPELTLAHFVLFATMLIVGVVVGWILRSNRATQEKAAVNTGWREQIEAQRSEHDRLTQQNRGLMEQIGQYQASNKDVKYRAKELSEAVQEAYSRRDSLQREIKDIRDNLEVAVTQRDKLQSSIALNTRKDKDAAEQDTRIVTLTKQLESWQNHLPPLVERFQQRNEEAKQLERDLANAQQRIVEVEESAQQRIVDVEETTQQRIVEVEEGAEQRIVEAEESAEQRIVEVEETTQQRIVEAEESAEQRMVEVEEGAEQRIVEVEALAATEQTRIEPVQGPEKLTNGRDDSDDNVDDIRTSAAQEPSAGLRDALQRIKGIGPAIEKTLNEMGIFRFQQIADMTEYDIDRIARRLKGFHSRIYRENWTGQARDLRDQRPDG